MDKLRSIKYTRPGVTDMTKDKVTKTQTTEIIARILVFIPVMIITFVGSMFLWIKMMRNFVIYGGESNIYNKVVNRKTIQDVFEKVMEQQFIDKEYCSPPNITYCNQAIHPEYNCEKEKCIWINRPCFKCKNVGIAVTKDNDPCKGRRGEDGPCVNYNPNK